MGGEVPIFSPSGDAIAEWRASLGRADIGADLLGILQELPAGILTCPPRPPVDGSAADDAAAADTIASAAIASAATASAPIASAAPASAATASAAPRADLTADDPARARALEFDGGRPELSELARARLDGVVAIQRLTAYLDALEAALLSDLAGDYPGLLEFLPTEVAIALGVSEVTASTRIDRAIALRTLPGVCELWRRGELSTAKVLTISECLAGHPAEIATAVQAAILPQAAGLTPGELRRRVRRLIIRLDTTSAEQRHRRAARSRCVYRRSLEDGMAALTVESTAQDIARVWDAVTLAARHSQVPDDERSLDACRADALVDLCCQPLDQHDSVAPRTGADTAPGADRRPRQGAATRARRALVRVTMPSSVLLGGSQVCELDGYGPITAEQARDIAADADLRRLICDPVSGRLLVADPTVYRPPANLADHVLTRDRTCVAPGCRQPAWRCEIDHITAYRRGGLTEPGNLATLCRHHHRAKDGGGHHLWADHDGNYHWRTPLGQAATRPATQHYDPTPCEPGVLLEYWEHTGPPALEPPGWLVDWLDHPPPDPTCADGLGDWEDGPPPDLSLPERARDQDDGP